MTVRANVTFLIEAAEEGEARRSAMAFSFGGVTRLTVADATFTVPPSRALWIPAGVEHAVTTLDDVDGERSKETWGYTRRLAEKKASRERKKREGRT